MARIDDLVENMQRNPQNVRFSNLDKVCRHYFGEPRNRSTSHYIYKTPWQGDPRINIQRKGNKAKPYQVRQVLVAIKKLQELK